MLGRSEIDCIADGFCVYDHEWRFYSKFLGSPTLVDDLLLYFDGEILFVCAFPLKDPFRELTRERVAEVISPYADRATGVNIWGRFACPATIRLKNLEIAPTHFTGYDDTYPSLIVPVDAFDFADHPKARKSISTAHRNGARGVLRDSSSLTYEHQQLVLDWIDSIQPSRVHQTMAHAAVEYAEQEGNWVIDVVSEARLVGFAILSFPNGDSSVMLNSFRSYNESDRRLRIGDIISATALTLLKEHDIKHLHRGYSTTASLESFKRKWGASVTGPRYSEAFFTISRGLKDHFETGTILKSDRR